MKEPTRNQNKKIQPEFGDLNLTVKEQVLQKSSSPNVFNQKRNPLSFVVDWQLPEEYAKKTAYGH